jgi:pilus assembly protein CpaF
MSFVKGWGKGTANNAATPAAQAAPQKPKVEEAPVEAKEPETSMPDKPDLNNAEFISTNTEKPTEPKAEAPETVAAAVTAPAEKPVDKSAELAAKKAEKAEKAKNAEKDAEFIKLRDRIKKKLMEELDLGAISGMDEDNLREQIKTLIMELLGEEKALITQADRERLIDDILADTLGFGPIDAILKDDDVSELMVNGPNQVFVERKGKLILTDIKFNDNEHLKSIIDRIVTKVGRRLDESTPLCDARLLDGSRVNAVGPPLAIDGCSLTIRKFKKDALKIQDLINFGALTPMAAELLKACVYAHLNIIISGGTGSGKTTLLNVTSGFIPNDERIVTIEDAAELQLQQEHVVRLETRPPNIEGKGQITIRDLLKNSLRMRPDRIVIGEVRAGEALDMLQAMNTGHDGSLATLHANTPRDALRRLETLVLMAGFDLPQRAIREQVASAIHLIIQTNRLKDGSRKITAISEVCGMEGEAILMQDIFAYKQEGVDENGKIIGEFKYCGVRPKCTDKLLASGAALDPKIFLFTVARLWDYGKSNFSHFSYPYRHGFWRCLLCLFL